MVVRERAQQQPMEPWVALVMSWRAAVPRAAEARVVVSQMAAAPVSAALQALSVQAQWWAQAAVLWAQAEYPEPGSSAVRARLVEF